jgi:hypothetical protein
MILDFLRRAGTTALVAGLCTSATQCRAQGPFGSPSENSAFSIPEAELIQPAELNRILHDAGEQKPLIFQVGSRVLFDQAHISGSTYAGPGSQEPALRLLQSRLSSIPRNRFIVLYCGCCPWNRCPNIAPAFESLRRMGFSSVKVLYIANNFGADWVDKGYPVEPAR